MRFDLHIHSCYSRDARGSIEEIVRQARRIGLEGLAVTDHNSFEGSAKAYALGRSERLVVVRGVEVSAVEGHVLALGVRELVPRELPVIETVERIRALGGIAVAAHPHRFPSGIGLRLAREVSFDAIEVINGASAARSNRLARRLAEQKGATMVGGSDAHDLGHIGRAYTVVEGVSTEDDLLDAIRHGRTVADGRGRTALESLRYPIELLSEWVGAGFRRV